MLWGNTTVKCVKVNLWSVGDHDLRGLKRQSIPTVTNSQLTSHAGFELNTSHFAPKPLKP